MDRVDWRIRGYDISNCNCAWGCPCQFMALPTQGYCHAAAFFRIDRGHFGKTPLDGLAFGGLFAWPEAVHKGDGHAQPIIDLRANDAQREALLKIMSGEETEPGATIFSVFATTYSKVHAPLFRPIHVEIDLEARTARVEVEGILDARVEPIRNPVTGEAVRAQIVLPAGFEYERAEAASGRVQTKPAASIPLGWDARHAHLARIEMTGAGVVRDRAA